LELPTPEPESEPEPGTREAAMLHGERRRLSMEQLAKMGMRLAQEIVERAVESPYHPEIKHEPGRAFAQASRAVRLSLVLEARFDEQLMAIRNGVMPSAASFPKPMTAKPSSGRRGAPTPEAEREALRERTRERLEDIEIGDVALDRFEDAIEDILSDLGLDPDVLDAPAVRALSPTNVETPTPPKDVGSGDPPPDEPLSPETHPPP
jgi:hypothetical protein